MFSHLIVINAMNLCGPGYLDKDRNSIVWPNRAKCKNGKRGAIQRVYEWVIKHEANLLNAQQ